MVLQLDFHQKMTWGTAKLAIMHSELDVFLPKGDILLPFLFFFFMESLVASEMVLRILHILAFEDANGLERVDHTVLMGLYFLGFSVLMFYFQIKLSVQKQCALIYLLIIICYSYDESYFISNLKSLNHIITRLQLGI